MNKWLGGGIAVAAALIVGAVLARVVRNLIDRPSRPEGIRKAAAPIASLVFSAAVIVGLIVALGFVDPDSLDQLPQQLIDYVPRALSAAIVVIAARVAASFLAVAIERSLGHAPPAVRLRVPGIVKGAIMAAAALIAATQLGIDTTVLRLAAAALFFSIGLAAALMIGLGSRRISSEVAAGRALRRMVSEGDHVALAGVAGRVAQVHPTAIELTTDDGEVVLVPHSQLIESSITLKRKTSTE